MSLTMISKVWIGSQSFKQYFPDIRIFVSTKA